MKMFAYVCGIALACSVSGCSTNQLQTACVIDGVAQPIVVAVGVGAATVAGQGVPAVAAAGTENQVHAAVQGACGALGGQAVVNNTADTTVQATTKGATAANVGGN